MVIRSPDNYQAVAACRTGTPPLVVQTYAIFTEVDWGSVRRQLENKSTEGLSPTKLALNAAADDTAIIMEWWVPFGMVETAERGTGTIWALCSVTSIACQPAQDLYSMRL